MNITKPLKLQTQLYFAYVGIILLFFAVFSVFFYEFVLDRLIKEGMDTLKNTALSIHDSIESAVSDMDTVSININYSSIVRSTLSYDFDLKQDTNSYKALADLFVLINGTDSRVDYIYLYDLDGNCLQVDSTQKLTSVDIGSESWYLPVLERGGGLYLSAPYTKKVSAYTSDVISLYRTYVDSGKQTTGIVETVKRCKKLFSPIVRYETNTTDPAKIYIYNESGQLIYPYESGSSNPNYPEISPVEKSADSSVPFIKKTANPLTGRTEYTSSLSSSYTGWTYYAVQDESVILSPLHTLTSTLLFFVGILVFCALIISHYLSRILVRPIGHLKHIIQRMQLSNLGTETPDSYPVFSAELKQLYDSFSEMNTKLKVSRDQLIRLQEAELESRSLALQSQMSPHFYYNSLSSIMILAENGDSDSVAQMCQNLSGIMRYVTDFKTRIVTVHEELRYTQEYLYCMKIRNQSSLNYEIDVPPELYDIRIPKLCIHPLVENALKYGTNCNPPWKVKIRGVCTDDFWKITIEDVGPGFSEETLEKLRQTFQAIKDSPSDMTKLSINGLGLANIYVRLSIYFEGHFIFEYGNTDAGHAYTAVGAYYHKET